MTTSPPETFAPVFVQADGQVEPPSKGSAIFTVWTASVFGRRLGGSSFAHFRDRASALAWCRRFCTHIHCYDEASGVAAWLDAAPEGPLADLIIAFIDVDPVYGS